MASLRSGEGKGRPLEINYMDLRCKGILQKRRRDNSCKKNTDTYNINNMTTTTPKKKHIEKWIKIAHLNCRGLTKPYKREMIENWAKRKSILILVATETKFAHTATIRGKR